MQSYYTDITRVALAKGPNPKAKGYMESQEIRLESVISSLALSDKPLVIPFNPLTSLFKIFPSS